MDEKILLFINGFSSPVLDNIMLAVTTAGGGAVVTLASVSLMVVLYKYRRWRPLLFVFVSVFGGFVLNLFLKLLFARPRPELWDVLFYETTYSFPSGHAMFTATIALCVVILTRQHKQRRWIIGALVVYVVAVGFSRMYLGVHYLSDVLAGWLVAAIWVVLVAKPLLLDRKSIANIYKT